VLSRLVNIRFQSLFTPLAGVLFTFPSRYWFTIGHQVVFSLGRWSSQIPTGFHESRRTQVPHQPRLGFVYRAFTFCGGPSQDLRLPIHCAAPGLLSQLCGPTTPTLQRQQACTEQVWALPRSLATTSGISDLISFPEGTEMFQFSSLATPSLCIQLGFCRLDPAGVSPFGHLRINARLQLPVAFRS